jgi:5-methylcytosine-specific restriction endonuclease McrA
MLTHQQKRERDRTRLKLWRQDNREHVRSQARQYYHIFPKSKYPELALNLNNGIALCKEHHYEFHKLNGFKIR